MATQAGDAQRETRWPKHKQRATRFDFSKGSKYVPGQVLVRFRTGTSKSTQQASHSARGAQELKSFFVSDQLQLVKLPSQASVEESIAAYKRDPNVLYAEPNYIVRAHGLPDDPRFSELWGLNNTGQGGGTPDADIDAPEAWNITTGSSSVVIAVIDSGIDYTHPDLTANMFRNTADCNANGVDDDGNGFIDDCYGIDTINVDSDPMDDLGHGTHVAGTIGASGNNSLGVTGVNWNIKLLPCKFIGADGYGDTAGAIACLDYVAKLKDRGVNIVATNNSWGGAFFSQALEDAFRAQLQRGILAIVSAGNDFKDNDLIPSYPASFYLPNVISVAATDRNDALVSFSNVGQRSVYLGAPGREILSTIPGGKYAVFSGTSMSAPHVSGVVGLLYAQDPNRDWRVVKNLVLAGGDNTPDLSETITGKRLNAYGALTCAQSTVTSRLRPFEDAVAATLNSSVRLSVLNINCGSPNGAVQVVVQPGGTNITLSDDGLGFDQAAGDGIYSAEWTPPAEGSFLLSFPDGSKLTVVILENYKVDTTTSNYRSISGTNLDLSDDSVALLSSPFPIPFGNGRFTDFYVSSNGTISFTNPFGEFDNIPVPTSAPLFVTLVAPFWDDLFPVRGTNQNVFWEVQGAAPNREFIVEWRDVRVYECESDTNATVKFQVVFRENSPDILFNYADATFGGACGLHDRGGSASVGVQVAPSTGAAWSFGQGLWSGNPEAVNDGMSILWQLAGSQTPPPNPIPSVISISPSSAEFNGPGFQLLVTGSNFLPSSRVRWNGYDRVTTFVSGTQLQALIPFSDLYFPVTDFPDITVFNPSPGGGNSNSVRFTITKPLPNITSLSPDRAFAGGMSFRLKVVGTGFHPSSRVRWNGMEMQSYFYATTEIVGLIPTGLLANVGTAQVSVISDPPGGGVSNSMTFTIEARPVAPLSMVALATASPSAPARNEIGDTHIQLPKRFYGWKTAASKGMDYLNHFVRLPARNALPVKNPTPEELAEYRFSSALQQQAIGSTPPGFLLRPALPAGFIPTGVAAGDFDRDGKNDWVVSNGGNNTLWIYRGRGDGSSDPPVILPLKGASPVWISAGDLRGNGILDLIVAEADSGTIGILPGRGDGTFGPEITYALPAVPLFFLVDDFDGDHVLDILVGVASNAQYGPVLLLPGKGDGSFGPLRYQPTEAFPPWIHTYFTTWFAAADANQDGFKDIVLIDFASDLGAVAYENKGDGTFKRKQLIAASFPEADEYYLGSAMTDLNGDGCPEAITVDTLGLASIYLGKCDGTFDNDFARTVQPLGIGDAGISVVLADLNGDSLPDLIVSGITFQVPAFAGIGAGNLLSVMLNDGHGSFGRARVYRGEPSMYALAIADLNGDGRPEVITANQDSDSNSVFLNDGTGSFSQPEGLHIGWQVTGLHEGVTNITGSKILARDVDGDGHTDLVLVGEGYLYPEPRPIIVALSDGTGKFRAPIRSPGIEGTYDLGDFTLGDFRGTGRLDFVAVGQQFNASVSYLIFAPNIGNGQFGPPVITKPSGALGYIAAGDFNGDGKLDLAVASTTSSQTGDGQNLAILLGNGDGTFGPSNIIQFGGSHFRWPVSVHVGDFNHDGRQDILVRLYENVVPYQVNDVYEFLGKGDGTFATPRVVIANSGPIEVADLNGDNLPDIIEARESQADYPFPAPATYRIFLGQADGSFSLTNTYTPFTGQELIPRFLSPSIGDFDGDGKLDIAVFQFTRGYPQHTYLQVLTGNGDGSFVPSFVTWQLNNRWAPQFVADVTGDGRADLIELDGFTSSLHVIPAGPGRALELSLISDPVLGANGTIRIVLARPAASSTTILLSASDPAITLPSSAVISSGNIYADVPFQIGSGFDSSHVFSIQAQLGSESTAVYGTQASLSSLLGFRLFAPNTSQSVQPPQTPTSPDYMLGAFSIEGYASSVSFHCNGLPAGVTCSFGQNPLSFVAGGSANTSLFVTATSAVAPGTYSFTVNASDGTRSDQVQLSLDVIGQPDFSMGIFPGSLTVGSFGNVSYNLNVSPMNNFSGSVAITCSGLPPNASCAPYGGQPPVIDASSSWAKVFVIQTQHSAAGDYAITFTGTGNSLTRAVTTNLHVVDFTVTPPSNTTATVSVGGSAKFSFMLTSQNGFNDTVTFGCVNPPNGITCSFNPPNGMLATGGNLTTELTVVVSSRPSPLAAQFRFLAFPSIFWMLAWTVAFCMMWIMVQHFRGSTPHPLPSLRLASVILALVCFGMLTSCGGGGGGSSGPPPPPPAPQPVVVNLTVQVNSSMLVKTIGTLKITVQ